MPINFVMDSVKNDINFTHNDLCSFVNIFDLQRLIKALTEIQNLTCWEQMFDDKK